MVGMAAGLARAGFRPIVYGLSAFVPVRVLEQIKLDVAHDNLPVLFIGDGAGFVYSHLGTSHQSTEDIACARVIPQLGVYSPADRFEITLCMDLAYRSATPAYLRMGKSDRGDVHAAPVQAQPGELLKAHAGRGDSLAFIATGSVVRTALDVAKAHHPDAEVWSVPTIKPIDATRVADICARHGGVVVLEEHSTIGGLGALVAEISTEHAPTRVLRIGVPDRFSEHCGSYEYLLQEHGLDTRSVTDKVAAFAHNLR